MGYINKPVILTLWVFIFIISCVDTDAFYVWRYKNWSLWRFET